jgi:hydroxymethylglutaryl-CoA reductase
MRTETLPEDKRQRLTAEYRAIDKCLRVIGNLHKEAKTTADVSNHLAPKQVKTDATREATVYAEVIALLHAKRGKVTL